MVAVFINFSFGLPVRVKAAQARKALPVKTTHVHHALFSNMLVAGMSG